MYSLLSGDGTDWRSKEASEATAKITGGSLDYLIANGARLPEDSHFIGFVEQ